MLNIVVYITIVSCFLLNHIKEIHCGMPPTIHNARMLSGVSTTLHTTLTYVCLESYVFNHGLPSITIQCQDDGEWKVNMDDDATAVVRGDYNAWTHLEAGCLGLLSFTLFLIFSTR